MPGAERVDIGNHAPTDQQYPPKCVTHITWDRNATASAPQDLVAYANLKSYFGSNPTGRGVAPHILWDPFHGTFAQFLPADSRALSLEDHTGGTRTNRAGSVVLQIEALFFPFCRVDGKVYEHLSDTPGKGWDTLHAWVKSWGVADTWPMGRPTSFAANRSESTWESHGGWYGHQNVPENVHQDPGSWFAFPAAPAPSSGGTTAHPQYQPFPGAAWFTTGRRSPIVAAMHKRLVAVGCNKYKSTANQDVIGSGDVASYEAWQRKLGYTGSAATWPPGETTWNKLQVPKVA